jgi:hypothetical protein
MVVVMKTPSRIVVLLLACWLALLGASSAQEPPARKAPVLAVIVNPKNPETQLSTAQLRDYFLIEREYWPNKKKAELHLPSDQSVTMSVLLEKLYRMSKNDLRKHWVRKIFRGKITDFPAVAPTAAAAIKAVRENEGAFSVVLLEEVTEDVRILPIDGKLPGDEGYPLVGDPDDRAGRGGP